ncbi:30S ribosomal protein S20 [Erysipelothrix sp. D19-032]
MFFVEEGRKDDAVAYFNRANELLDKSITSNIHHPNYVSRQKSTLAKLINTI